MFFFGGLLLCLVNERKATIVVITFRVASFLCNMCLSEQETFERCYTTYVSAHPGFEGATKFNLCAQANMFVCTHS